MSTQSVVQASVPVGQVKSHTPPWQVAVAPPGAVHSALQLPQFSGSVAMSSQPLTRLPSQLANPRAHSLVQLPPLQVVPGQGLPQAPQCAVLVCRSTH